MKSTRQLLLFAQWDVIQSLHSQRIDCLNLLPNDLLSITTAQMAGYGIYEIYNVYNLYSINLKNNPISNRHAAAQGTVFSLETTPLVPD